MDTIYRLKSKVPGEGKRGGHKVGGQKKDTVSNRLCMRNKYTEGGGEGEGTRTGVQSQDAKSMGEGMQSQDTLQ